MRLRDVADQIPAATAQLAVAEILAALGSQQDWDSDTLDRVAAAVAPAHPKHLPSVFDQDDDAVEFWENVQ